MTNLKKVINQTLIDSLDEIFTDNTQGWRENPVTFRVFVESPEHMAFEPLSERQYEVADFMLSGEDPKKIFFLFSLFDLILC